MTNLPVNMSDNVDAKPADQVGPGDPLFAPASWAVGPHLTDLENERMWFRTWHCAGREEELPEIGDYLTFDLLDESVLVVRTGEDAFTAYYNVCQHRGRQLQDEPRGNVSEGIYCRFHGWAYDLDGSLNYVPDREDFCPAMLKDVALKAVRLDRWAGWLWVNMDPDAEPLRESLGPIVDLVEPLKLENTRRFWHATIHAPVNWKVVIGAFNEGYHSGATHDSVVSYRPLKSPSVIFGDHSMFYSEWSNFTSVRQPEGDWRQVTDVREDILVGCRHMHQNLKALVLDPTMRAAERVYNEMPENASLDDVLAAFWRFQREETEATGAEWPADLEPSDMAKIGTDWHIFPSTIFLPSVDGALWYRVLPGPDGESCYFDIWSLGRYAPGEEPVVEDKHFESFDSFRGNNPFLEEDFANMMAVHKGMRSRGWDGAILNPYQEKQQMVFMKVLQRYLAEQPTPPKGESV